MDQNSLLEIHQKFNENQNFENFGRSVDFTTNNYKITHDQFIQKYSDLIEIYSDKMSPTSIYIANNCFDNEKVIVKQINKSMLLTPCMKFTAENEFPLHCGLKHENIVEAYDYCENEENYIMAMEFCPDAGYFEQKIDTCLTPIKSEIKIKSYMHDILSGLKYIHSQGIVHLDLKLANLFIEKLDENSIPIVKISDFGLSRKVEEKSKTVFIPEKCGTFNYTAPEIKNKSFIDAKSDIWSVGICLYKMCVAYKPTQIGDYTYGSGPIPFRKMDWRKRSKEIQDFIVSCLETDPNKRPSAEEALSHKWFDV